MRGEKGERKKQKGPDEKVYDWSWADDKNAF
jgi:hypothetical protein